MPKDTETSAPEIHVACRVLKYMTYGDADLAPGHRFKLPKSEADALVASGFVEITGL